MMCVHAAQVAATLNAETLRSADPVWMENMLADL